MDKNYVFNTSLPRSGSTLFQNIVGQNPEFYVTPTSGFLELVYGARGNFISVPEFKAQDEKLMSDAFVAFCRLGMDGYFNSITTKKNVLDKNRGWIATHQLASLIVPNPKMVCIVRDLRAIYASMEKKFRNNPTRDSQVQNPAQLIGTTLKKRVDIWSANPPIGLALDRLRDALETGVYKSMLFIRYEDLMANPEIEMERFYKYIGMPVYSGHNFTTITQITQEDDRIHGIYGDHDLRSEFKRLPDDYNEVLGFELSNSIRDSYQWFYSFFNYI